MANFSLKENKMQPALEKLGEKIEKALEKQEGVSIKELQKKGNFSDYFIDEALAQIKMMPYEEKKEIALKDSPEALAEAFKEMVHMPKASMMDFVDEVVFNALMGV
jgi:hypothetical protein